MQNRVEEQQDKFFDDLLKSIKPSNEEIIERKIHHIPFSKIVVWLCLESRKKLIFNKQELRKFTGLSNSRVQEILNDLVDAGLIMKKSKSTGKTYYTFVSDNKNSLVVKEYFKRALKTLGKKPKKKLTFSIEQNIGEDGLL